MSMSTAFSVSRKGFLDGWSALRAQHDRTLTQACEKISSRLQLLALSEKGFSEVTACASALALKAWHSIIPYSSHARHCLCT